MCGSIPATTGLQLPSLPGPLQALHPGQAAASTRQQTPSVQCPLWQSVSSVQGLAIAPRDTPISAAVPRTPAALLTVSCADRAPAPEGWKVTPTVHGFEPTARMSPVQASLPRANCVAF